MPMYEYSCTNEKCENKDAIASTIRRISDRDDFPLCEICHSSMPRVYTEMPSVSWRYLNANGVMANSCYGPAQRADRRCAGWDRGVKVLQPVYSGMRDKNNKDV